MFQVSNRGFHMFFKNGCTLSVQFVQQKDSKHYAEISAWDKEGKWIILGANETVPYVEADELLTYMQRVAK